MAAGFVLAAVVAVPGQAAAQECAWKAWGYDVNSAGDTVGFDRTEDSSIENLTVWPDREVSVPRILPAPQDASRTEPAATHR